MQEREKERGVQPRGRKKEKKTLSERKFSSSLSSLSRPVLKNVSSSLSVCLSVCVYVRALLTLRNLLIFSLIIDTQGTASTLTKSEVRGGGRKPYKQKGTGNARLGSKRSPLLPGGGVTFGPKPKDWSIKMNKKERRLAMATAIQSAASSMIVVDSINSGVTVPKSKAFQDNLKSWGVNVNEEKTYVITKDAPKEVELATRNMARVVHADITKLNVYDVLNADKVVVDEAALGYLNDFYGASGRAWA